MARRFARLSPHLQRALVLSLRLADVDERHDRPLSVVLERMGTGALVLDGAARVLLANAMAERTLATSSVLRLDEGKQLTAVTTADTARLTTAIRVTLEDTETGQGDHVVRLTGLGQARSLTLLVSPLPRPAFIMARSLETASVMILVLGGDETTGPGTATRSIFGLSAAEVRVSGLVASGKDRPEVARLLGISLETVKKHLQQCFVKTGTHSQAEMSRLLLHVSQRAGREE